MRFEYVDTGGNRDSEFCVHCKSVGANSLDFAQE